MVARAVAKLTGPLKRRVMLMLRLGVLHLVRDGLGTQELQVALFGGEVIDRVKSILPYGFTHHPHGGSEVVVASLLGTTANAVALVVGGRAFRLQALQAGEVAIYDDLGQKVHLTRSGIVVDGAGLPILVTNTPKLRMETPLLEVTGEVRDRCDSDGTTMEAMRQAYNAHVHPETDNGGPTGTPTETM